MRRLSAVFALVASFMVAQPVVGEEARTTRIVTQPVYGATVTVEHGVRVYRPVPPTTHMIVNPDGAAPVVIGADAQRIVNQAITIGR
jgi:hypothetical protein